MKSNPHNPENENEPDQQEHPSHEAGQRPSPAIYVASLADYNNGVLHGAWIDAAREPSDIQADINAMLARSREPNAEEFAIFDYNQFGRCRIHENDPIDLVARIARGIREHGYAFAAWADVHEDDRNKRLERFDDFRRPISATTTPCRTMPSDSLMTSVTPSWPSCPSRCGATCASTPKHWPTTWSRVATSSGRRPGRRSLDIPRQCLANSPVQKRQ